MEDIKRGYIGLTFELLKRGWLKQKWYFRIISVNNKVLASSENYFNKEDCMKAIKLIKEQSQTAPINIKILE